MDLLKVEKSNVERLSRERTNKKLISHLFLIIGGLVMILPVLWLISSAFKPNNTIFERTFNLIPSNPTVENFIAGWNSNPQQPFSHFLLNTFALTIAVVIGTVLSCSMTAFGFARLEFKFKQLLFMVMLSTLMLPMQATLISRYLIFKNLGWIDTYLPFIVPAFLGIGSFHIFLLTQFIRGLPKELDESARIDGCSTWGIYWKIIMPLSKPAIFSVIIFTFLWTWDDFLPQLIYISSVNNYTVSLVIRTLLDATSAISCGSLIALSLVALLPGTILFFLAQSFFVEGIAVTGLKG